MSGPVLCALPSVASHPAATYQFASQPAAAYQVASHPAAQLPGVNKNVQPIPFIETSRQCSTCISLPPLPKYPDPVLNRKRWGEDNVIFKNTIQNACSGRNNFDGCHSVPDVLASKYEGYMFPKPMHQDLTVLHCSPANTNRHVPKDIGLELFPTHDPSRKYDDNSYVLSDATRKALSDYITQLYRTSRYDLNFRDTTDFMKRKADRDRQYYKLCGGSKHKGRNQNQMTMFPMNTQGTGNVQPDETVDAENIDDDDDDNQQGNSVDKVGDQGDGKEAFEKNGNGIILVDGNARGNGDFHGKIDTFGPWSGDAKLSDDCEPLLMSHVYNFKLPSSHHNPDTENEYASSHTERHGCKQRYDDIGAWTALRRPKMTYPGVKHADRITVLPQSLLVDILEKQRQSHEAVLQSKQNNWTFRDENTNLRIPCISKVIGYKNKTDVHKKIHVDHPEPMPDLRDFKRYSKRVNFFGYNSSVFR